jgi:hypothetical protein
MGIEPIIVSAGELEHESAGYPAWLMRARYRYRISPPTP